MGDKPKQGIFESNKDYRDRVYLEGKENIIENATGSKPKQGFLESKESYRSRIAHEANESIVESAVDSSPQKGFFESEKSYRSRMNRQANELIVKSTAGASPKQGFFESEEKYRSRIAHEANESIVETAVGSTPKQGFFESKEGYRQRINREAKVIRASSISDNSTATDYYPVDRRNYSSARVAHASIDSSNSVGVFILFIVGSAVLLVITGLVLISLINLFDLGELFLSTTYEKIHYRVNKWADQNLRGEDVLRIDLPEPNHDFVTTLKHEVVTIEVFEEYSWAIAYYGCDRQMSPQSRDMCLQAFSGTGYIIFSTDSGTNWEIQTEVSNWTPMALQFTSEAEGYAIGDTNILYTKDGGDYWHHLGIPSWAEEIAGVDYFDGNQFVDGNHIILFFNDWVRSESFDGGKSWQDTTIATTPTQSPEIHHRIYYSDKEYVAPDIEGNLRRWIDVNLDLNMRWTLKEGESTWDSGSNWYNTEGFDIDIQDYSMVNDHIWAVGDDGGNGFIFHSPDGGLSWELLWRDTSIQGTWPFIVYFNDEREGWTGMKDGLLYTQDGGANWEFRRVSGEGTYVDEYWFFGGQHIEASKAMGSIHVSYDGGNSWK